VVDQVLSREINPEIVNTINQLGGMARGFSGTEIFTCRKLWLSGPQSERVDPGFVGEVTGINTAPLLECIQRGITPVISPTARGDDGQVYNCNADVAAAQAAIALKARRLVFMSDVPGLLRNPKDPNTVIAHLRSEEVSALKQAGIVDQGMIPKVDSAVAAIRSGWRKSRSSMAGSRTRCCSRSSPTPASAPKWSAEGLTARLSSPPHGTTCRYHSPRAYSRDSPSPDDTDSSHESPAFMLAPSSLRPYRPDHRSGNEPALIRPLISTTSLTPP
jgi:acetylglutamate kinase